MGIYATKSKWQRALAPVVDFCVRHRIHPDVFTYGALLLSALAGLALFVAGVNAAWLWLAPPLLLLRLLFNLMDGLIARAAGIADPWGEVKNEFGDRIADAGVYLGLVFGGYADARLAALVLALVQMVSYLGILGKAVTGVRVYGGIFGKGDRAISLALFTLYAAYSGNLSAYNWFLLGASVAALVTIVQRVRLIHAQQSVR